MKNRVSLLFITLLTALIFSVSVISFAADTPAKSEAATAITSPASLSPYDSGETAEVVDNPYGIEAVWKEGGFIARGTLLILTIMSMGSWYILITKLLDQLKLNRQAGNARRTFWKAASVAPPRASATVMPVFVLKTFSILFVSRVEPSALGT